eukprot:3616534-Rhodomonas_salina.4
MLRLVRLPLSQAPSQAGLRCSEKAGMSPQDCVRGRSGTATGSFQTRVLKSERIRSGTDHDDSDSGRSSNFTNGNLH